MTVFPPPKKTKTIARIVQWLGVRPQAILVIMLKMSKTLKMSFKWLFFFQKKLLELPSGWGLCPQASIHVIVFKMLPCSKCHPNGVKMAVFFQKQLQELLSGWGLCYQAPMLVVTCSLALNLHNLTTFKIVITRCLNKQMLRIATIIAKPSLTIIPCIFING